MRAAAITAPGVVEVVDRPEPVAHDDLVVVKIVVAPMCTEHKDRRAGNLSDSLGHEAAGVVVDAGRSHRVSVGDRVVVMPQFGCGRCRYCTAGEHIYCPFPRDVLAETGQSYGTATFAQYVLKPDWLLLPVPDDIDLLHASAACCLLGPSFTAATRMHLGATDTVLVAGLGPVGLGAVIHGRSRGARVLALETHPHRVELATALGARVLDPFDPELGELVRAETGGWGVDASIETSGVAANPAVLAGLSARRARMAIIAWGSDISLPPLVPLGLDIHGCWHWNHQVHGSAMISTIRSSTDALDTAITDRFDLERVSEAMDLQDTGRCGKVVLLPFGEEAL
ncbi:zinc-binding dehydrogenase [Herbiconiux sp. KACC 21604]|uniref:zinc-dependent alcohol dehydrogenase n=1 Tax=unclassified Herbiconiux TaxID=2618217 RepID=UPI00149172B0|nr:zinc-binding dehydrogenase [Herbiconiux sp. SALV-R1]QJU55238.1 alcohol dehydrogenase catalytic domain-containing protein [Herbiconiux sp. SALV-R1]WPO86404.1 zinc-binding dehydrogenase [Herbiconiux sp. KACC 21604]